VKQPALGLIIAGKYRLERPLASGGMGSVWVARHLELDIEIAIKFMGADLASTSEGRVRFQREAKAAAFLQSPYVVSVQDYGVDDDLPYIVMELLKGEDLEDRLRRRKRLSLQETLTILSQISKALGRAHEIGIVHRDLKPRNLFLASVHDEEIVKILDFGLAKQINPLNPGGATTTRQIIGSPHYMSPEQIRGAKDIDHRTDLWSLGVILFQTVTGKLPFSGEVLIDVLNKVISGPLPLASEIAPALPHGIDDFFLRAFSRDRSQRFQSAREMTEALADLVRSSISAERLSSAGASGPLPTQGPAVTSAVTPANVIPPAPARFPNPEASTTVPPLSATEPLPIAAPRSDLETAQRPAVLELSRPPRSKGVSPKSAFAVAAVLACALAIGGVVGRLKRTGSQTQGEPLAEPQVSSGSAPAQRAELPPAPTSPPPPATQNPQEVTVSPSAPASAASPSPSGSAANAVNSTVTKAPPPPGPTRNTGPTRPPPKPPVKPSPGDSKNTNDEWF
jgi:serine/threonine-protein kinase